MVSEGINIVHQGRAAVKHGSVPTYTATAQTHTGIIVLHSLLMSKLDIHVFCWRNLCIHAKLLFLQFFSVTLGLVTTKFLFMVKILNNNY